MKKVTVVTVARNALEALKKTMKSVKAQTYPELEYIVVDGDSTDGTANLLAESEGIRWISEPDKGIYDAMNKGVGMATGHWVIFMNAGDTFASDDALQKVISSAESDDADVIYGDVVKRQTICKAPDTPVDGHRMFFCHQSCLARTELLIETPFDINHRLSADFKWVKTMLKQRRRFVHVNVPIAVFDTSGVSNSSRSRGLADNMKVLAEVDSFGKRIRLLPHLIVPYLLCRVRGK